MAGDFDFMPPLGEHLPLSTPVWSLGMRTRRTAQREAAHAKVAQTAGGPGCRNGCRFGLQKRLSVRAAATAQGPRSTSTLNMKAQQRGCVHTAQPRAKAALACCFILRPSYCFMLLLQKPARAVSIRILRWNILHECTLHEYHEYPSMKMPQSKCLNECAR